jgi:hypothetical protein
VLKIGAWVAVVLLVGGIAAASVGAGDDDPDSGPLTMAQLSQKVAGTWQSDLRDAQRKRGLSGKLWVAGVDCIRRPKAHFVCLAHVAATGEARRIAPRPLVITGRLGAGGGWVARERD